MATQFSTSSSTRGVVQLVDLTTGGSLFNNHAILKKDHPNRPCWTSPEDGRTIYMEAGHELYQPSYDFLVAIAEPVSRPESIHEYRLTEYSLYAAVATNIETQAILTVLERLSKNHVPTAMKEFVRACTTKYGKVRLVLKRNIYYIESAHPSVLRELLHDPIIAQARVAVSSAGTGVDFTDDGFERYVKAAQMKESRAFFQELEVDGDDDDECDDDMVTTASSSVEAASNPSSVVVSFPIDGTVVGQVKRAAHALGYPLLEEYDFGNDQINPNIPNFYLKPTTKIRHYQERGLAKMFGNGRARSGMIVLPCGAGKTLTGCTAAQTIKKSVLCLVPNTMSVLQWKEQFQKWTTIPSSRIVLLTGDHKEDLPSLPCVLISTYSMIAYSGLRGQEAQRIMEQIRQREWGLLLLDEVHVVPANTFRRVVDTVKAHCRLGLSATLVREDDLIKDLAFLVGPKLYEANWMDLTRDGYLAPVQCVDICCPMTGPFQMEYLAAGHSENEDHCSGTAQWKQLLYVMNPAKLRATEYLVRLHEERGDKIILFSDMVFALKEYAVMLGRPFVCGKTPEWERQAILSEFRNPESLVQTICLSQVGDVAIDLPDANVVVQVGSHYGARRQEAQRLGRILRPKPPGVKSFFYTLVSTDTQDMYYRSKRQQYLIDQGYTFKIVTTLCALADEEAREKGYSLSTPEDDRDLLQRLRQRRVDAEREQQNEATTNGNVHRVQ